MKKIEVISIDRIGLVGEISKVLSRVNGNIITHTANPVPYRDAYFRILRADVEGH